MKTCRSPRPFIPIIAGADRIWPGAEANVTIHSEVSKLFLDAEQLVILGHTVGAAQ